MNAYDFLSPTGGYWYYCSSWSLQIHSSCILWHGDRSREQDWTRYQKFVLVGSNRELPDGRIIATKGEAGFQAKTLAPGLYWSMWPWQYGVDMQPFTIIPEGKIGLVLSGTALKYQQAAYWRGVLSATISRMQKFLENGGQRGRQTAYVTAGSYRINNYLFDVTITDQVIIHENMVGIVTALDGEPIPQGANCGQ